MSENQFENYYYPLREYIHSSGYRFRGLVGNKNISADMMEPVLEKLKEHLIAKNVAADISQKLCDSVLKKLEGKVRRNILPRAYVRKFIRPF